MYADTRFQLHDSNGWDFLPVAFRFDSGTVDVKCNVLPEYEQLIDSLKDNDMRKRLARAKAKALLMYAYAQKQNDGHLVDGSQKSSERLLFPKLWMAGRIPILLAQSANC